MRQFFKNRFFYVMTIVALLVTIVPMTFAHMGVTFVFRDAVNILLTPMQKVFHAAANAVEGFSAYFYQFDALVEENAALKEQVSSLQAEIYDVREMEQMYAWMSDFLELKRQHTDYRFTAATVTGRESGNYSSVFTLDTGTGAGIRVGMPVITSDGIVGYITEVGYNWSRVTTLVEAQSAVGAYVERSNVTGVVEGNFATAADGLCVMRYLSIDADIQVGDRILSSGYGDIYPRGLVVGYVQSIDVNPYSRSLNATIQCAAPLSTVNQVMIITEHHLYAAPVAGGEKETETTE